LKKDPGVLITIGNAAFLSDRLKLLDSYKELLKTSYKSEGHVVNFDKAEDARQQINRWVENQTNSLIKDLLPPNSLDALTRLVLASAIYFKGTWNSKFDAKLTAKRPFTLADGSKKEVYMMEMTKEFAIKKSAESVYVEIPYKGGQTSMAIFMPLTDTAPNDTTLATAIYRGGQNMKVLLTICGQLNWLSPWFYRSSLDCPSLKFLKPLMALK